MPASTKIHNYLNSYLLALIFCLPLCGTLELFFFLAALLTIWITLVQFFYRREKNNFISAAKNEHPIAFYSFIAWFFLTQISFLLLLVDDTALLAKAAASARQLFIFMQILFLLSLLKHQQQSQLKIDKLLFSFVLGCLTIAVVHFFTLWLGPESDPKTWVVTPLLAANIRDIANLFEASTIICLTFFLFAEKACSKYITALLFIVSYTYVIWSGGRAAIVFTSSCILLSLALFVLYKRSYLKPALVGLLVVSSLLLSAQLSIFEWNGFSRYKAGAVQKNNHEAVEYSNGRMDLWKMSINAYKEKPLFGLGPYSFFFIPERIEKNIPRDQPHNLLIQTLLEWGIIGSLLFFIGSISLYLKGLMQLKHAYKNNNASFIAASIIILLFFLRSLTGGALWNFQPVTTFIIIMAVFLFQQNTDITNE